MKQLCLINSSYDLLTRHCSGNNIYRPPSGTACGPECTHTSAKLPHEFCEDDCATLIASKAEAATAAAAWRDRRLVLVN